MEEKFEQQDYNWLYYALGLFFGALTGFAVEGHIIIGAILGLLTGGLFQFVVNKNRGKEEK
jgi:hypothetical protein